MNTATVEQYMARLAKIRDEVNLPAVYEAAQAAVEASEQSSSYDVELTCTHGWERVEIHRVWRNDQLLEPRKPLLVFTYCDHGPWASVAADSEVELLADAEGNEACVATWMGRE